MAKDKKMNNPTANVFSEDALIKGNLKLNSDIRIDGTVEGDIHCEAKVVIGASGKIVGNIVCNEALIEGTVNGNINVKTVLDIRSNSKIEGDMLCSKLIVEEGATFNGICKMNP